MRRTTRSTPRSGTGQGFRGPMVLQRLSQRAFKMATYAVDVRPDEVTGLASAAQRCSALCSARRPPPRTRLPPSRWRLCTPASSASSWQAAIPPCPRALRCAALCFLAPAQATRPPPPLPAPAYQSVGIRESAPCVQILSAYFVLLPLRDEAAVALGTHALPPLFAGSLLCTLLAAPGASAFLSRHAARRERGLQRFYTGLGSSMLGAPRCGCGCAVLSIGAQGRGSRGESGGATLSRGKFAGSLPGL
jgi:hypothetical protein